MGASRIRELVSRSYGGAVDDDCLRVSLSGVACRISCSYIRDEVGIIADVASAVGITEREIAAAGQGLGQGHLVAVGDRILISCRVRQPVEDQALLDIITGIASDATRLRFQWTMPGLAALSR